MTRLWEPCCRELNNLQVNLLDQWSPTFSAPGTGFVGKKRQFSQGLGCRVWGGSNTLHLLCTLSLLFLHQLHLRSSSGISPWNLGTPVVRRCSNTTLKGHMVLLLPFPPVQMIFLNTESNQTLFCVCALSMTTQTRVQSRFSLTSALIKGVLKGTTLIFSIYKHFLGHPHLHVTEPTLQKNWKKLFHLLLSDESLLDLLTAT